MKNKVITDIRILFEHEEEDYYKPARVGNFWSNNYIDYESNSVRNKTLSIEEYHNKIRTYLKDIINNLKKSDTWKTQLTIVINFMSSKYNDEERVMHSKDDDIGIMINDKADEVIEERFESHFDIYQTGLETSVTGSDSIFDCVQLLYYKCHKINPNRGGSYVDYPDWIRNKNATVNPINKKDHKSFQYSVTIALNHEKSRKDPQRMTKIKPFINKYNCKRINYHQKKMIEKI